MLHYLIISAISFCPHPWIYCVPAFNSHGMIYFLQQLYEVHDIIICILQETIRCQATKSVLHSVGDGNPLETFDQESEMIKKELQEP